MPLVQFRDVNWEKESTKTEQGQKDREERKRQRNERKKQMAQANAQMQQQLAEERIAQKDQARSFLVLVKTLGPEYFKNISNDADLWDMQQVFPDVVQEGDEEHSVYVDRIFQRLFTSRVDVDGLNPNSPGTLSLLQEGHLLEWNQNYIRRGERIQLIGVQICNEFLRRLREQAGSNFEDDTLKLPPEDENSLCGTLSCNDGKNEDLKTLLQRRPLIQAHTMPIAKFLVLKNILWKLETIDKHPLAVLNNQNGENSDGIASSASEDSG